MTQATVAPEKPAEAYTPSHGKGWLKPWKPGQSGNPNGGKGSLYVEAMQICKDRSPDAARKLVKLMDSDDERVAFMASKEILERAWGKPKEMPQNENDPEAMDRRAQLIAAVVSLLSGQPAKSESK